LCKEPVLRDVIERDVGHRSSGTLWFMDAGRRARGLLVIAITVMAAGCSSGSTPPPLSSNLVTAFNDLYAQQRPVTVMKPAPGSVMPVVSEASAIAVAKRSCNDGPDPTIVGIGLVTVTGVDHVLWAVFVNPPGSHYLPNGAGTGGETANWYVVLVDAHGPPGCSVGADSRLPALPVHR
jgi:hypothetical protein